jgi:hypothetical protein
MMNKAQFATDAWHLIKGQGLWMSLVGILLVLFLYGELTGTRLFNGTTTETWKPQGAGIHNSINHK